MSARLITLVGSSLLLCAACSDGANEVPEAARSSTGSSMTAPAAPPTDSAASTPPVDDPPPDPVIAWLDGVDQDWDALWPATEVIIDHDCVMLKSSDETGDLTTLSVWPTGTTWDREAEAIVLSDGFVVQEGDVIAVGGGVVPFIEGDNNLDAAGLGDDGLARLKTCSAHHPNVDVWLLDAGSGVGPAQLETNLGVAATVPSGERPAAATTAELTQRLEQLDFPELEQPIEAAQDWNGVLVGWIFTRLADDETWYLCNRIDESLPPGCGTGVQLVAQPSIVTEHPERFETINDDSGVPSVVMSVSLVSLEGTFLHDSALFLTTE